MQVRATTDAPSDTGCDTVVVGILGGEGIPHDLEGGPLQALVDSGEAKPKLKHVVATHAGGLRWLLAGLGDRSDLTPESARVAAAAAASLAGKLGARRLCWELPHKVGDEHAAAIVEGTLLGAYRFDRYKSARDDDGGGGPEELVVSAHHDVSAPVERAALIAEAVNAARDLQNAPANDMTPERLAERARELAAQHDSLRCEVLGREQIRAAGMGAFSGVAQGTEQEPALITLRYEPEGASGPTLGFVGKAVTFDSGGISLKPGKSMSDMKFDMSGGAAVLEATGAIARLGLPVRLVTVLGATENMPSGRALKPGDILTAKTGTTIEIVNTDAEGRLVLADCLAHARDCGAERLIDLATLTGAIIVTFGSTHAGLFASDDAWAASVEAAGERTGELVWRLPLHPEYEELIKGRYADIANANEARKAASITAAEFLRRFTGDVPWAHLDIAGTAWDVGREYTGKAGSGFGVRLLVELAASGAT